MLKPELIPEEFRPWESLAQKFWPLLPVLVRLRRNSRSSESILKWWYRFANATFVAMLLTPGKLMQPVIYDTAKVVAAKTIHWGPVEDFASEYFAKLARKQDGGEFVLRYEPKYVNSLEEAADNAVAYALTSMKHEISSIAREWRGDWSASKSKRVKRAGLPMGNADERLATDRALENRQLHKVDGYYSPNDAAKKLGVSRTTIQNARKRALDANAIALGPNGYIRQADVRRLKQYMVGGKAMLTRTKGR
jgi:hypothetical protein